MLPDELAHPEQNRRRPPDIRARQTRPAVAGLVPPGNPGRAQAPRPPRADAPAGCRGPPRPADRARLTGPAARRPGVHHRSAIEAAPQRAPAGPALAAHRPGRCQVGDQPPRRRAPPAAVAARQRSMSDRPGSCRRTLRTRSGRVPGRPTPRSVGSVRRARGSAVFRWTVTASRAHRQMTRWATAAGNETRHEPSPLAE
jgi:hypothetical protein